MQQILLSKAID